MMLKKFLKRTFSPEGNSNSDNFNRDPPVLDLDADDSETDGFLLIGSTLSERKSVKPGSVSKGDFPPSYDSLFIQEKTMGNAQSTENTGVKPSTSKVNFEDDCAMLDIDPDTSTNNRISQNNNGNALVIPSSAPTVTNSYNSVVAPINASAVYDDIPFTLSPALIAVASLPSTQAQLDVILRSQQREDLQNFKYEFTLEKSVIRDAGVK